MLIDFASLKLGRDYDRPELAQLWGYKSFHALGRGVFTPAGHNAIVLFITEQQQPALPQYQNSFDGEFLWMDGEDGHKSDNRLANSLNRDTVRLFHRKRDHSLFRYFGEVSLIESFLVAGPHRSRFVFASRPEAIAEADAALRADEQIVEDHAFKADPEGRRRLRLHFIYERSKKNRDRALAIHGRICIVCGFDFDLKYGVDLAQSYIEVHHLRAIREINGEVVDPKYDLAPVCANCHRMAHRKRGATIPLDELRSRIQGVSLHHDRK
jgi:hypothetical protein